VPITYTSHLGATAVFDGAKLTADSFLVASSSYEPQVPFVSARTTFGGNNNATFQNGTQLTTKLIEIGLNSSGTNLTEIFSSAGDSGTLDVTGTGTSIQGNPAIHVGVNGFGILTIENGASVQAGSVDVASTAQVGFTDLLNVNAATLSVSQAVEIGYGGVAQATFSNGAKVSAAELDLGFLAGSKGTLNLSSGAAVHVSQSVNIGSSNGANGDLILGGGALIADGTTTIYARDSRRHWLPTRQFGQ
jgi:T5SS/PEP-CTERM-associated repeat protein